MADTCHECGLIHPPVAGGCPVAKERKMKEDLKGVTTDKSKVLVQAINIKLLEKMKLLNNKDRVDNLCADVFKFIEEYK